MQLYCVMCVVRWIAFNNPRSIQCLFDWFIFYWEIKVTMVWWLSERDILGIMNVKIMHRWRILYLHMCIEREKDYGHLIYICMKTITKMMRVYKTFFFLSNKDFLSMLDFNEGHAFTIIEFNTCCTCFNYNIQLLFFFFYINSDMSLKHHTASPYNM